MFGHLFPPFFKNWWSDDWISTVYGVEHTFRCEDVQIQHNVNAQKTNGLTRYAVDQVIMLMLCLESYTACSCSLKICGANFVVVL